MNSHKSKHNILFTKEFLKFFIPSLIGIILFMIPIPMNDSITIPIAILSSALQNMLMGSINRILLIIIGFSFIMSFITLCFKPKWIVEREFLKELFLISPLTLFVRLAAFLFMILAQLSTMDVTFDSKLQVLINIVASADTGGLVLADLLPVLFSIFLFAGLFLPLLLDFGLLEFIGSLLVKIMRPVFHLPGRSAIDCIASWLGDGTIGVLLTSKQYEDGFYTKREAAVIGTTFSLVSITFSLVVINTVGLGHMFVPFYLVVCIASLLAAIILPKLPPLSRKKDVLIDGSLPSKNDDVNSSLNDGLQKAVVKASQQNVFKCVCIDGLKNVIDMWLAVIPTVMAVGTAALILATYTPLFEYLGMPFTPLLNLLQIPEAAAASQTLIAGFADMLLPSIMAANVESELTRFIIASVSVTQLIYLSEVGALLLGSKIPIKLWELFIIFLERTLITLPIISLLAHIIF